MARVLAALVLVDFVSGHGALVRPRSRNKIASDIGRFYDVHALRTAGSDLDGLEAYDGLPWPEFNPGYHIGEARPLSLCGTHPDSTNINGGQPFNFNVNPGNQHWGDVEAVYREGNQVTLTWEVSQNHNGYYSYRICNYVSDMQTITDDCFEQPMLKEVGTGREWIAIDHPTNGAFYNFTHVFQLPAGLTCERCVLVWRWDCMLTTEVWHNCADISITERDGSLPPVTAPPVTAPPSPAVQPTEPEPTGCRSIYPGINDAWCESNCNYNPPYCPVNMCVCN
jgi:hypothetical protein